MKNIESLRFKNFSFSYQPGVPIFEGVNFVFPKNSYVVLSNPDSGAGSSTLFQLLSGILEATSGDYLINNQSLNEMSFEDFLPYRLNLGYSFDQGGLLNNRTLLENLTLPLLYHKIFSFEKAKQYAQVQLEKMNILQYANLRPSIVQGSVRKATVLLRSVIMNPQILFLDDPSHGLTPETTMKFVDLIEEKKASGALSSVYVNSKDPALLQKIKNQSDVKSIFIRERQIYEDSL